MQRTMSTSPFAKERCTVSHQFVPPTDTPHRLALAMSRWESDSSGFGTTTQPEDQATADLLRNAELVQLRVRVVALENLVIALLATTLDAQTLARDMAQYISPRPGHTEHPLTLHAASLMKHLIDRATYFGAEPEARNA